MTDPDSCEQAPNHPLMQYCGLCGYTQPRLEDDFPCCSQSAPSCSKSGSSEDEVPYDYPGDARHAAADALIAAGLVDPDDGTVPRWRRGEPTPIWTNPMHVVETVLKAALPHLRAFQVETQVRVGYELGRREAGEALEVLSELVTLKDGPRDNAYEIRKALVWDAAREVTKGDPNG
jgi:hypothetical protein